MISDLYYFEAPGLLPYRNQALEEHLLDRVQPGELILYLWQNQHTVVIGRNQNCWKECRVEQLQHDHGYLARRLSGGGAVFHDTGNLNFTFIATVGDYDLQRQLDVIINALAQTGIKAVKSGRNDILIDGRKFSGNAFYKRGDKRYHHGTIMVDVDTAALGRYLQPSPAKLAAKGVDSVRSRVANLVEFSPSLSVERLRELLIASFSEVYHGRAQKLSLTGSENSEIERLTAQYADWQWICGHQADLASQLERRFPWGEITIQLQIEQGMINDAAVYSDAMEGELILQLAGLLTGCRYQAAEIAQRLRQAEMNNLSENRIIDDITAWLATSI